MQYLRDNIDEIRDNVALLQHSEYVAYCQFKEFSKDQIYNYKVYKEVLKDLEFINNEWEVDIDLICKYFNISATEVPVDDLTKFF